MTSAWCLGRFPTAVRFLLPPGLAPLLLGLPMPLDAEGLPPPPGRRGAREGIHEVRRVPLRHHVHTTKIPHTPHLCASPWCTAPQISGARREARCGRAGCPSKDTLDLSQVVYDVILQGWCPHILKSLHHHRHHDLP